MASESMRRRGTESIQGHPCSSPAVVPTSYACVWCMHGPDLRTSGLPLQTGYTCRMLHITWHTAMAADSSARTRASTTHGCQEPRDRCWTITYRRCPGKENGISPIACAHPAPDSARSHLCHYEAPTDVSDLQSACGVPILPCVSLLSQSCKG